MEKYKATVEFEIDDLDSERERKAFMLALWHNVSHAVYEMDGKDIHCDCVRVVTLQKGGNKE